MKPLRATLGFMALSFALIFAGHLDNVLSISLVLVTLMLTCAARSTTPTHPVQLRPELLRILLSALIAAELLWFCWLSGGVTRCSFGHPVPWPIQWMGGFLAIATIIYWWPQAPRPNGRFILVLSLHVLLGVVIIKFINPKPLIDVWFLQQEASAVLAQGENPYDGRYTIPIQELVGPQLLEDGKATSFPYPPLSLLTVFPGYLIGDVRWSLLLAQLCAMALLVLAGRRLGLPAGHPAELAVLALLAQPFGLTMMELAWTESLLALAVIGAGWALASGKHGLLVVALLATVSLKQYGILVLPAFYRAGKLSGKDLAVILGGSALIALPFLLWDPRAFWRGIVDFHVYSMFRTDTATVPTLVHQLTGVTLPPAVGFGLAAAMGGWVLYRGATDLAGVMLGAAATLLVFFAFNKSGANNYYWLALVLLAQAVIATAAVESAALAPPNAPEGRAQPPN
ncbi:MAG: hypothetical protein K2R98_18280 [Gemmataceae bacterium]|nr:hypothetical protein [Gemmataceae bacterium]